MITYRLAIQIGGAAASSYPSVGRQGGFTRSDQREANAAALCRLGAALRDTLDRWAGAALLAGRDEERGRQSAVGHRDRCHVARCNPLLLPRRGTAVARSHTPEQGTGNHRMDRQ